MKRKTSKEKKKTINYRNLLLAKIKEKKIPILIGISVFIILYIFLSGFILKDKTLTRKKITSSSQIQMKKDGEKIKKYIVKEGDYLWKIAEENYGSGFNAYDIIQANKIENPDYLFVGQELILPKVTPKLPTRGEIAVNKTNQVTHDQKKYIVKEGDSLWTIALQAYGDGYAWVKIAEINKINNPNDITPGQVLILP